MHKHHGNHSNPNHHANILMYGHRGSHKALGGPMMSNTSQYSKGGKTHKRRHHDEGGSTGVNPVTGTKTPSLGDNIMEKRRGGRACHAEGDTIKPLRRGGKAHRKHHDDGGGIEGMHAMHRQWRNPLSDAIYAEGGKTEPLKRGGKAHHKHHHHAKGEMVETMHRGGKKKHDIGREHHDFGDVIGTIGNLASNFLPLLPLLLKKGGSASHACRRGKNRQKHGLGDYVVKGMKTGDWQP